MNRIKILTQIVILILLTSCSSCTKQNILQYDEFPVVKEIHGENIGPKDYFAKADQCLLDSSILFVLDGRSDHFFHFFDTGDFHLLGKFLMQGRGPDEIVSEPYLCQQRFIDNKGIYFYDPTENKIVYTGISPGNGKLYFEHNKELDIPNSIQNIQNVSYMSADKFVARGCLYDGKLAFFNTNNGSVKFTPFYPKMDINKNKFRDYYVSYYGDISFNETQNKLACSNREFNQIEVYSKDGGLLHEIRFGDLNNPFANPSKKYFYYNAISTTSKYIYSSFIGVKTKNLKFSLIGTLKTQLHVYDWEGNAIAFIKLDRLTGYFCVDEDNQYLFAIDETNARQPLVKYNLKGLF